MSANFELTSKGVNRLSLVCTGSQLGIIDVKQKTLKRLDTGYTSFRKLAVTGGGVHDPNAGLLIVTTAGSASKASAIVQLQVGNCDCLGAGLL